MKHLIAIIMTLMVLMVLVMGVNAMKDLNDGRVSTVVNQLTMSSKAQAKEYE